MHTFKYTNALGEEESFNYNPDMSGYVYMYSNGQAFSITGDAVLAFAAHVKAEQETASADNTLSS